MTVVKAGDVLAYRIGEELVCGDCLNDKEKEALGKRDFTLDQILTREEVENNDEDYYFCDRCKKRII